MLGSLDRVKTVDLRLMAAGLGKGAGRALTIGAPYPSFTQRFSPPHRVSESALGPDPRSAVP